VNFSKFLSSLKIHFTIKKTNPTLNRLTRGPFTIPNPSSHVVRASLAVSSRRHPLLLSLPLFSLWQPGPTPLLSLSLALSLSRMHQEAAWTPHAPPRPTGAQRARPRPSRPDGATPACPAPYTEPRPHRDRSRASSRRPRAQLATPGTARAQARPRPRAPKPDAVPMPEAARPFTHDINGVSIATVTPSPTFSLH
jgi:hypothetical protein